MTKLDDQLDAYFGTPRLGRPLGSPNLLPEEQRKRQEKRDREYRDKRKRLKLAKERQEIKTAIARDKFRHQASRQRIKPECEKKQKWVKPETEVERAERLLQATKDDWDNFKRMMDSQFRIQLPSAATLLLE